MDHYWLNEITFNYISIPKRNLILRVVFYVRYVRYARYVHISFLRTENCVIYSLLIYRFRIVQLLRSPIFKS